MAHQVPKALHLGVSVLLSNKIWAIMTHPKAKIYHSTSFLGVPSLIYQLVYKYTLSWTFI
jgi:hypothetical protein